MSLPDPTELFQQYNRGTRGWANYFRFTNSKRLFCRLAYYNWWTFYRALRKRHGKRSKSWVLNHDTHRVPSPLGTRTTLGLRVGEELLTMFHLAGVSINRLQNPSKNASNPYLPGATTQLEPIIQLYPTWHGEEARPGQNQFSRIVRQRDKVCHQCGQAMAQHAHHLKRWSKYHQMNPTQGVGLCQACHIDIHRQERGRAV